LDEHAPAQRTRDCARAWLVAAKFASLGSSATGQANYGEIGLG
jgi:hypothetical protein